MAKEKKVDIREMVYERVASALMQDNHTLTRIRRHKEGLEFQFNDEIFALRAVKKKDKLSKTDFRGEYFLDTQDNSFGYKEYSK